MKSISEMSNRKKIILVIVAAFAILVLINIISGVARNNKDTGNKPITQNIAENVCQNEANVKTQDRNIDVVSASNYKPQFTNNGDRSTLSWNGKSKDGSKPAFVCELSGTEQNPKIELLQMGSERLQ